MPTSLLDYFGNESEDDDEQDDNDEQGDDRDILTVMKKIEIITMMMTMLPAWCIATAFLQTLQLAPATVIATLPVLIATLIIFDDLEMI